MAVSRRSLVAFAASSAALAFAGAGAAEASAAIQIDSPVAGAFTNDTTPTYTYSDATPSDTVSLLDLGGTPITAVGGPSDSNGDGTLTPSASIAPVGPDRRVLVQVRDENTGNLDNVEIKVDQIPSISGTGNGSKVDPSEVQFAASDAIPDNEVRLYIDGDLSRTVTAEPDGTYFDGITPTTPLAPGTHTADLRSVDDLGVESSPSDTVTFDVAPPAPLFAQLPEDANLNQTSSPVTLTGFTPGVTDATVYEIDENGDLVTLGTVATSGGIATIPVTPRVGTP